jgi:hypothetical protein
VVHDSGGSIVKFIILYVQVGEFFSGVVVHHKPGYALGLLRWVEKKFDVLHKLLAYRTPNSVNN